MRDRVLRAGRGRFFALFLAIGCLPLIANGSYSKDKFLDRLAGHWRAEGVAFGMQARYQMKWEWVLDGRFARISYRIDMKGSDGKEQFFEGHGYYSPAGEGNYEGRWFDSQGEAHPIKASLNDNALVSIWGTPETKQGKSIYRLLENGNLELSDSLLMKDGTWRRFNHAIFERQ